MSSTAPARTRPRWLQALDSLERTPLWEYVRASGLRSVVMGIDPAAIGNLEDFVRSSWNYPDLEPLINDIDEGLRDRVALFVRTYDYPPEKAEDAPHREPILTASYNFPSCRFRSIQACGPSSTNSPLP